MRRFFLTGHDLSHSNATIRGDLFKHLVRVLRLKAGDRFILADGRGTEKIATITEITHDGLAVSLQSALPAVSSTATLRISLLQGLPKGDKMDLILQKCTELGISAVVPVAAVRSVSKVTKEREEQRLARWRKIVHEASRQSGRPTIPDVLPPCSLKEAVLQAKEELKLLLWEDEKEKGLKEVISSLSAPQGVAILVGPEGGFSPEEVAIATGAGFIPVSLGKRILRTETAGFALVSIIQFVWGDIG